MAIKENLIKMLSSFIFEIEVGFDNISCDTKKQLAKFLKELEKNEEFYKSWITNEYTYLLKNSDNLKKVSEKVEKLHNNELEFLYEIKVFNEILDLNLFKEENRKTKKDICILLYNIYKTIQIIKKGFEYNVSEEQLNSLYDKYVTKIDSVSVSPSTKILTTEQNSSLQSLVTDMLGEFQKGELNPMELLQDILKGPENISKEGTSINKFTKKFEKRLNNDKMKKEIENQFGSIFKNLANK